MLPWLRFEPHIMDLAILYNQMTVGTTDLQAIAEACGYGVLTPKRKDGNPAESGDREQYGRALKRFNPKLRLAAYVTINGGMIAAKGANSNQPFHDGELAKLLQQHPNLAMRDAKGKIIYKGDADDNDPQRMALMNPAYPQPILDEAHRRNFREIMQRAGDIYEDGFGDDVSNKFIAFGRKPAIIPTLQYGDPLGDDYYKAHLSWHKRIREIITSFGLGYAANIGGGNDFIETRGYQQIDVACTPANGVPGLAMLEHFFFTEDGEWNAKHMDGNMLKAVRIRARNGRQLFVIQVDPRTVQPGARREEDALAAAIAGQIANGGQGTYMRWAADYNQFMDVAIVREIGQRTGKPKAGAAGEPRRISEGVWERDFENARLRVNANTRKAEIIETPIVIPTDPQPEHPEPRVGLLHIYGVKGVNVAGLHLRNDHSKTSQSLALLYPGTPVKLLPITFTNEAEKLTFTNLLALVNGSWESGWVALDGPTWHSGLVPSITTL